MSGENGTLIVTGGSRGIGAATSRLAGARGYNVAVNYRSERGQAEAVVMDIEKSGGRAVAIAGDVADEAAILNLFERAERELGPITGLVNNAGTTGPWNRLDEITRATIQHVLEVNVIGSMLCAREAVKRMSTAHGGKGGVIVNLSSRAAELGSPNSWIQYAASKGAIESFTRGLALEVAREGIRVNAVQPGLIDTEIHVAGGGGDRLKQALPSVPLDRIGTAEEVAETIFWLLSPASSYVTGTTVKVSGGR
ncbi:MAG TPA: SDR family oxidoreductase [Magnetospirillaceae bacterium]|jgi:NAD(P)-dependent dehydrogenase (short-subunit alcohol dehydrogenase family)